MRKVNDVINYVLNLARDIKTTGSATGVDQKILNYVQQDKVPYAGILNKTAQIQKDLEKIDGSPFSNISNAFREYLKEYPVIIGDSNPGSHVDISQAAINNGFVFMLGLVVTALATELSGVSLVPTD
jgi:hypothetical protein